MQLSPSRWVEREGDASFYRGDYSAALLSYRQSLEERKNPGAIFLKLSDVHFKLGDFEQERHYREKIYGRLDDQ